jgi:hypothetical protein
MPVAMMDVRTVRMSVSEFSVMMDVGVWLAGRISR